eukprot:COSAG02_NODE_3027_length_7515_cov_16.251214_4_plen_34_part_00
MMGFYHILKRTTVLQRDTCSPDVLVTDGMASSS